MNLDAVFSRIYLRFTTLNASQNSSETAEKICRIRGHWSCFYSQNFVDFFFGCVPYLRFHNAHDGR